MSIVVLNQQEVNQLISIPECIDLMADLFKSLTEGKVFFPLRSIVKPPDAKGILSLMPAYISDRSPVFGLKAICVFHDNPRLGKDAHQGVVQLFSSDTGELLAVMNASAITAIRTAAVSAVATKELSRKESSVLAIIGTGVQARHHLTAISAIRSIKLVKVYDLKFENAAKFTAELSPQYPFPIEATTTGELAIRNADIIVTVTNSKHPVLKRDWIATGAHLNAVGACTPDAREIDAATVAASRLYVDWRESAFNEAGDYIIAAREGTIPSNHIIGEIGEVLAGKIQGRTSDKEITLFKAVGLAAEDLVTARYVYLKTQEKSAGTWVDF